jgi:hypothetical protein
MQNPTEAPTEEPTAYPTASPTEVRTVAATFWSRSHASTGSSPLQKGSKTQSCTSSPSSPFLLMDARVLLQEPTAAPTFEPTAAPTPSPTEVRFPFNITARRYMHCMQRTECDMILALAEPHGHAHRRAHGLAHRGADVRAHGRESTTDGTYPLPPSDCSG